MIDTKQPIAIAITGASGSAYGLRLLELLLQNGRQVYLMISKAGEMVIPMETGMELPSETAQMEEVLVQRFNAMEGQLRLFGREEWTAPVASGSNPPAAMVVCPCTAGTLSAISTGASNNLIERAADVMLKEQRRLILVVRETPLSAIHLENMLKLARLGVVTMPASPGFYNRPRSLEQIVDFMVARVLDHLEIQHDLIQPWGED
ncbi:MAG: UbiX family flavin prenyltransferase [Gammaproteobacteria bacterium]|nr:UbiX family flavin prenyltransferase [Gammaproteobacteria bacterium]